MAYVCICHFFFVILQPKQKFNQISHDHMATPQKKKRVLVTFVEAGFGHITTANSIATAIEALQDPNIEVIRKYMFKDDPKLRKIEKSFVRDVKWANTFPWHNYIQMAATHIGGIHNSLPFVVSLLYRRASEIYLKQLEEIRPDIIIDTHYPAFYIYTELYHIRIKPVSVIDQIFNICFFS